MPRNPNPVFFVYILQCRDGSYYTGHTANIERRVQEHNHRQGGRYTRGRAPVELVYVERHSTRKAAVQRELQIKKLARRAKRVLIATHRGD